MIANDNPDIRGFIKSIQTEPSNTTNWMVFADWLREHDDPRADSVTHAKHYMSIMAQFPGPINIHESRTAIPLDPTMLWSSIRTGVVFGDFPTVIDDSAIPRVRIGSVTILLALDPAYTTGDPPSIDFAIVDRDYDYGVLVADECFVFPEPSDSIAIDKVFIKPIFVFCASRSLRADVYIDYRFEPDPPLLPLPRIL